MSARSDAALSRIETSGVDDDMEYGPPLPEARGIGAAPGLYTVAAVESPVGLTSG